MTILQLIDLDALQFENGFANVNTVIIPNAIIRVRGSRNSETGEVTISNVRIKPANGYVLHDNAYDFIVEEPVLDEYGNPVYDEYGMPVTTEVINLGYRPTEGSVGYNYDFTPFEMQDEAGNAVTAYGSRQFFCKLANDVPENQIFDVTQPNLKPELM